MCKVLHCPEALDSWQQQGITHGFFTRIGGRSNGIYAGLNCGLGSQDDTQNVQENLQLVQQYFSSQKLFTLQQIHSAQVIEINHLSIADQRPIADAMVSSCEGIALGVLSADCAPILFCDPRARVIGAAHAGWKGAFKGVLKQTLLKMVLLGADLKHIQASIGPTIASPSYEVDAEFRTHFIQKDPKNTTFFIAGIRDGFFQFNLPAYIEHRLLESGLKKVFHCHQDTYAQEDKFYSYRRSTHRGEPDYGRQISAICIGRK